MSPFQVLVVDDEEAVRVSLAAWLERGGYGVSTASGGAEALSALKRERFDLVLLDIKMPGMDGHELLRRIKSEDPGLPVVLITAYGSIESAVTAMKQGASDYLLKPFDPEHLMFIVERLVGQKKAVDDYHAFQAALGEWEARGLDDLIGQSETMRSLFSRIEEVAQTDASVLITGETGTGKELVARAIHSRSRRHGGPFIAINCGAVPASLLESELFGHERGAFTGAVKTRLGRLEMADQGTLFLDEVGEVTPHMQVNLLRVLEDGRFCRLGGSSEIASDFRLICATHRDLALMIQEEKVRSDFYYRINVIGLAVPPLRDRIEDIPLLAHHFLSRFAREMGKEIQALAPAACQVLQGYPWPGNVRELKNVMERAVVASRGRTVNAGDLSFLRADPAASPGRTALSEVEAAHMRRTLESCAWNLTKAAGILGIDRGTLARRMKRHGLKKPQ